MYLQDIYLNSERYIQLVAAISICIHYRVHASCKRIMGFATVLEIKFMTEKSLCLVTFATVRTTRVIFWSYLKYKFLRKTDVRITVFFQNVNIRKTTDVSVSDCHEK